MIDLLLKNGLIIDVAECKTRTGNIGIKDGVITDITEPDDTAARQVIDLQGKTVAPGFIDFHLHVESSLLNPLAFSREAVRHGTTAIFVDPHEIANVCGRLGIDLFLDLTGHLPLDMVVGIPSCVPATHLETSGSTITLTDIRELVPDERIFGLAEMMNFPGIINDFGDARKKVDLVFNAGKVVDGHCPGLSGESLKTYIKNGKTDLLVRIMSDHETTTYDEAREKMKLGMAVGLRYGSASKDMERILPGLINNRVPLDRFMLCSDDLDPLELSHRGHVDRIIRRAREIIMEHSSLDLQAATIQAIAMATINPGKYFSKYFEYHRLPGIGEIKKGMKANLVVLDSLVSLNVERVIHRGSVVVENGVCTTPTVSYDYGRYMGKLNVGRKLTADDFRIRPTDSRDSMNVRVIDIIPGSILTGESLRIMKFRNQDLPADPKADIAKIAVFERHHASGRFSIGFVRGLGIKQGALASTIAHDSHNLIVAGMDNRDMASAANHLIENGGGMVAMDEKIHYFPLKICGLMSTDSVAHVVRDYSHIKDVLTRMGSGLENPFMTLAFMALPVIPKLKITDLGLVDVGKFDFVELFA